MIRHDWARPDRGPKCGSIRGESSKPVIRTHAAGGKIFRAIGGCQARLTQYPLPVRAREERCSLLDPQTSERYGAGLVKSRHRFQTQLAGEVRHFLRCHG